MTAEEWADVLAIDLMKQPDRKHANKMAALDFLQRQRAIIEQATVLTKEAISKASGIKPTWTEARIIEVAVAERAAQSEEKVKEQLRDEAMDAHLAMMNALYGVNEGDEDEQ